MSDKPIIFLAFANKQDDYLPMVNRERKNIYRSLRWFHDNDVIKVETEATTSLEDIFDVFTQYDNQVTIFHYGGHAGSYSLELETPDEGSRTAYAIGLAQLLGRQQGLQLVFLNGCATKAQVEVLLESGVKAVIATSSKVEDRMATEFAELFYNALSGHSSIQRAFQIASAFISSKYQHFQPLQTYRAASFDVEQPENQNGDLPWGLYLNEDAEEVLNWTLPFPEKSYQASNTENLLNRVPSTTTEFVGYEKEISEFGQALTRFPLIAIEGLGGVGKTEFAIEGIKQFVPDRERVIWVSPITKFDVMVQQSGYEEILLMDNPDETIKFKSLEGLLDRDNRIVFIEDFHDNDDDTFLRFFEQLSINQARIIIITRFLREEIEPGVVIRLGGLGSAALKHARNLRKRKAAYEEIPDEDLETLCRLTEGHPLSLELGMQLLGYGESADDVLNAISGGDYKEHKKVEELSQRLLHSVLNHGNTSPRERKLLLSFSVFRDRVPLEAIEAVMDNAKVKYPLSQLIEKSLIRYRNKLYDTPPLVREFCQAMLKDKEEIHEMAADYFMDERSGEFDIQLEENIIFHLSQSNQWELLGTNIKKNGKLFIAHGQVHLLQSIIDQLNEHDVEEPLFDVFLAQMLLSKGNVKKAKRSIKRAIKNYREVNDLAGIALSLNVLGESNYDNPQEAKKIHEEALEIALKYQLPHIAVNAYQYLAYINAAIGQIEKAHEYVKHGLETARKLEDDFELASLLNVEGRIYGLQKKHNESLLARQKSLEIFSRIGARIDMVMVSNNIAVTLNALGKYDEALAELEKSLSLEKQIGAQYRIANLIFNIGKTHLRMGNNEVALQKFEECLEIQKSIGNNLGTAAAHHAIGMCFDKIGKQENAIKCYLTSLVYTKRIGYQLGILNLFKAIGNSYQMLSEDNQKNALEWFLNALALSIQINQPIEGIQQKLASIRQSMEANDFSDFVEKVIASLPEIQRANLDLESIGKI